MKIERNSPRFPISVLLSMLVHGSVFLFLFDEPPQTREQALSSAIKIKYRKVKRQKVRENPINRQRIEPGKTGSQKPESQQPSENSSLKIGEYSKLFPTRAENAQAIKANENAVSAASQSPVVSGTSAKIAGDLDLAINIPKQLRNMYISGDGKIKLQRTKSNQWEITYCTGDNFYKALVYERVKPLLTRKSTLLEMLESLGFDTYWVAISYIRKTSFTQNRRVRTWRKERNKLILVVQEWYIPVEKHIAYSEENEDGEPTTYIDIIGALKLAKDLVTGESVEPLDKTMRALQQSPAFSQNYP